MTSNKAVKTALNHFGYILQYRKPYSSLEFATLIKQHNASAQAQAIANELEASPWFVIRGYERATIFLTK